jgi:hypothetical protein
MSSPSNKSLCYSIFPSQCGSNSTIKIEIDDPAVESIEFVIVDEAQNKWSVLSSNHGSSLYNLIHLNDSMDWLPFIV